MNSKNCKMVALIMMIVLLITACGAETKEEVTDNVNVNVSESKDDTSTKDDTEAEKDDTEAKQDLTITYWSALAGPAANVVNDHNDILMFEELEKATGVTVEFLHPPANQAKEQFNLMIASGELPDVIVSDWSSYPGGPEKAISDGIIISLNDVIESHAPNYSSILNSNEAVAKQVKTDAGNHFVFPALTLGRYRSFGGLMLRKDMLDKVGLDVPETIDEWTEVLRAFKAEGVESPFSCLPWMMQGQVMFQGAYGVGPEFFQEDGVVKYGPVEPGYKEYITQMNQWYEEGLVDQDFAVINKKAVDSQILNNETAAFFGYIGGWMGRFLDATTDEEFDLVAAQYPVLNKGDEAQFVLAAKEYRNIGAAITTACENPEEVAEWLDYLYSEEGHMLKNFGVEGETYTMVDGKPTYTELITDNPEGLPMAIALGKYMQANYPAPGMDDDIYLMQYYKRDQQKEALETYSMYAANASDVLLPALYVQEGELDEYASLYFDIMTYREEMEIKFIMGVEDIENYDEFVEQIKSMNIDRILEIKQSALDRYNNR